LHNADRLKAMQLGAFEYLTKPLDVGVVRDVVRRALSSISRSPVSGGKPVSFNAGGHEPLRNRGRTPGMQENLQAHRFDLHHPTHTSVPDSLVRAGPGKELFARAIHANSQNAQDPLSL